MTTTSANPIAPPGLPADRPAPAPTPSRTRRLAAVLGGGALAVAPLLWAAGVYSSPPQDSTSNVDYVASMARAPFQAIVSANLLHYFWVLFALGILAAVPLFAGRPGGRTGVVLACLAAASSIQISGTLLSDFYAVRVSQESGVVAAANVEFDLGISADIWLQSGRVALLLIALLYLNLAFSKIISWWLVPVFVACTVIAFLPLPVAVAAPFMVASFAPVYAVSAQLITGRPRRG